VSKVKAGDAVTALSRLLTMCLVNSAHSAFVLLVFSAVLSFVLLLCFRTRERKNGRQKELSLAEHHAQQQSTVIA
jgi:hypothetical protein